MNDDLFFKAIADETSRRILVLIHTHGELCVDDLCHALNEKRPNLLQYLDMLREAGVLVQRHEENWVFNHLNPQLPDWIYCMLTLVVKKCCHGALYCEDSRRLLQMPNSCCRKPLRRAA